MSNPAKKILLHTDQKKIEAIKKEAVKSAESLNTLIKECEKVCRTTFDKHQRDQVRDTGMAFIKEYFKPQFQFPNADEKFNLQALGIDLAPLENAMAKSYPIWREYPIEQNENGIFELVGEPKQIQSCYTYTENEKQVRAYELAVKITDLINTAIEEKFIPDREIYKLTLFGILTTEPGGWKPMVNTDRISRIK